MRSAALKPIGKIAGKLAGKESFKCRNKPLNRENKRKKATLTRRISFPAPVFSAIIGMTQKKPAG
jgi:hypothetical protein